MKVLFLLLLFVCLPVAQAAKLQGGEIGNAFVPFESAEGDYRLEYPMHWKHEQEGATTVFVDPMAKQADKASRFLVRPEAAPGIVDLEALRLRLAEIYSGPGQEIEVNGAKGFLWTVKRDRIIHLLRASEEVVTVHLRHAEEEFGPTAYMLETLRVKKSP